MYFLSQSCPLICFASLDDIDLHVITPFGNEIYFENTAADLGLLDHDDIPSEEGGFGDWVENVFFPVDGSAPSGTYEYFVVNYDQIGAADSWELQVLTIDEVLESQSGTTVGTGQESPRFTFVHNN